MTALHPQTPLPPLPATKPAGLWGYRPLQTGCLRLRSFVVRGLMYGLLLSSLTGCMNQSTRVPSLATRPASIETRSWNLHDPFPDENVGPDTLTRPRSFVEPRRESFTSRELQFYQAAHGLRVDGPQYAQIPRNPAVQGFAAAAPPFAMASPMSSPYGQPAWGAPTATLPPNWQVPAGVGVPTSPSLAPGPIATTGPVAFQPEFVGGW